MSWHIEFEGQPVQISTRAAFCAVFAHARTVYVASQIGKAHVNVEIPGVAHCDDAAGSCIADAEQAENSGNTCSQHR